MAEADYDPAGAPQRAGRSIWAMITDANTTERHAVANHEVIGEAVAPDLARFQRLNDWMPGSLVVALSVPVASSGAEVGRNLFATSPARV